MLKLIAIAAGGLLASWIMIAGLPRMWRPLALIQKLLCAIALALLLFLGGMLAVFGYENGAWSVAAAGVIVAFFAFKLILKLFTTRAGGYATKAPDIAAPLPTETTQDQWPAFVAKLRWGQRRRAEAVKRSLDAFLAEQDSASISDDHRALLITVNRRVPELLGECLSRCSRATPEEQRNYLERSLASLEKIAGQAEVARREIRQADDRELDVLHRYFDEVSTKPA
jgi:hypothetical protein